MKGYSIEENIHVAAAYASLAVAQYTGAKLVKSHIVATLVKTTGRSRGSIESKFMNYSAAAVDHNLLPGLPFGYVKGYKPAHHRQKGISKFLRAALADAVVAAEYPATRGLIPSAIAK